MTTRGAAGKTRWTTCPECGRVEVGLLPELQVTSRPELQRPLGYKLARHHRPAGGWCTEAGSPVPAGRIETREEVRRAS